ncbi:hypothetical protein [Henriciella marina]|uniref:Integron cassette protein VCH-CASS1 chain domain-containing protein n=1 Tax=Henriciella marina TaxID=453851 RepID=A0ABT4LQM1_9PROT|nr:hypothetical protein [Henriciella marina]MCZ4296638.1 hypothetical protein [Henriciella marina]
MARRLKTDNEIDAFIEKVTTEANHHALNVNRVIQPLSEEVRERLDLKSDKVEVYEREGRIARTCWVVIDGSRYVFSYNYNNEQIDLRERSLRGQVLSSFENSTSRQTIRKAVAGL